MTLKGASLIKAGIVFSFAMFAAFFFALLSEEASAVHEPCADCPNYCDGLTYHTRSTKTTTTCNTCSVTTCAACGAKTCTITSCGTCGTNTDTTCKSCSVTSCLSCGAKTCDITDCTACGHTGSCGCNDDTTACTGGGWDCTGNYASMTGYQHSPVCDAASGCSNPRDGTTNDCAKTAWSCTENGNALGTKPTASRQICSCSGSTGAGLVGDSWACGSTDDYYCSGNNVQYWDYQCTGDSETPNCASSYVPGNKANCAHGSDCDCTTAPSDSITDNTADDETNAKTYGGCHDYTVCSGGPGARCSYNDVMDTCSTAGRWTISEQDILDAGCTIKTAPAQPAYQCLQYQTCADSDLGDSVYETAGSVSGNDLLTCNGACDVSAYNYPDFCEPSPMTGKNYILTEYGCVPNYGAVTAAWPLSATEGERPYKAKKWDCRDYTTPASNDIDDSPTTAGVCSNGIISRCQSNNGMGYCEVDRSLRQYVEGCYNGNFIYQAPLKDYDSQNNVRLSGTCGLGPDSCQYLEFVSADLDCGGRGGGSVDQKSGASVLESCDFKLYDADTAPATCSAACGQWIQGGEAWLLSSGVPFDSPPGEYDGFAVNECCGDDNNEFRNFKRGIGGDAPASTICCRSMQDCVFSNKCFDDIDTVRTLLGMQRKEIMSFYDGSGNYVRIRQPSDPNGYDKERTYADVNANGRLEVCLNSYGQGAWVSPWGTIKGKVTNISGNPVVGAEVRILGTLNITKTNFDGTYLLDGVNSSAGNPDHKFDIVASKSPYNPTSQKDVFLPDFDQVTVNFIIGFGSDLCEPDCTFTNDDTCHAECHGTNGCAFYDSQSISICDSERIDFRRPYDDAGVQKEIQCCEGSPYTAQKVKATTQINATTVVRVQRNVWYEGKLVKMVIDVFS